MIKVPEARKRRRGRPPKLSTGTSDKDLTRLRRLSPLASAKAQVETLETLIRHDDERAKREAIVGNTAAVVTQRFMNAVDKDEFVEACLHHGDVRFGVLAARLMDSRYSKKSYHTLIRSCKLSPQDLLQAYRTWKFDLYQLQQLQKMDPTKVGIMVEGNLEDAMPHTRPCTGCKEMGQVGTEKCLKCDGKGRIRVAGDIEAKKLAFTSTGLIKKDGPLVAVQQNFGAGYRPVDEVVREPIGALGPRREGE